MRSKEGVAREIKAAADKLRAGAARARDVQFKGYEKDRLEKRYAQQMTDAVKRLVEARAKNPEGAAAAGRN